MIGINVRNVKSELFADWIIDGKKSIETRESKSLHPYIGQRVCIVRTGCGKAEAIGEVNIDSFLFVDNEEEFDSFFGSHNVSKSSKFYIGGKGKYLYFLSNPVRYDKPKGVGLGIVSRKVFE